mgnify:CR=1 FL=1|tara:strand:- start:20304 stop:21923 length:1620 start_codon:yes stop_codon:yes gene_type:complete
MDISKIGGSNELLQKWGKALDGIKDQYTARVTAQLLENQAKAVLNEQSRIQEEVISTGGTTVGNIGVFQKFAFPLVRRVYPNLVFNYIGATQPMDSPVSQIFYLGNSRWSSPAGTGPTQQVVYSKFNLTYRGLVTSGIGSFSGANPAAEGPGWQVPNGGAGSGLIGSRAATGFDLSNVLLSTRGGVSTTLGGKIAAFPTSTTIMGWVVSAGERLDSTGIPEIQFHIEQQPVVARTRKMRALWTIEAAQDLKAYHNLDLEKELTELLSKELTLEIDRELIEDIRMIAYGMGSTGSLGGWDARSLDPHQDSNSLREYGQSPDLNNAAGVNGWTPSAFQWGNGSLPSTGATATNVWAVDLADFVGGAYAPQHLGQRFSNLLAVINLASQDIYKSTMRGPGTVLITSPLIAALLESAAKLEGGLAEKDGPTNMGTSIEYKGKFAGKYDLIVDPMFPEDEIIVGYKGSGPMDAGFVYCPYIPLMPLPMVTDPGSFQPRKGIMTRYAKAAVQPSSRFYRVIRLIGAGAGYMTPNIARNTAVNTWV